MKYTRNNAKGHLALLAAILLTTGCSDNKPVPVTKSTQEADPLIQRISYKTNYGRESAYLVQAHGKTSPDSAILVYFHGAGKDEKQGMKDFPLLREWMATNGWIYVSPKDYEIDNLLADVISKYGNRPIYLAGASAGGGYVFERAREYPSRFAGIFLIGPAMWVNGDRETELTMPTFLIFGDADGGNTSSSRLLVKLLTAKGTPVLCQEIKGGGHDSPYQDQSWWKDALEFVTEKARTNGN